MLRRRRERADLGAVTVDWVLLAAAVAALAVALVTSTGAGADAGLWEVLAAQP
ncbi:MAG: hypothetical protein ACU0BF_05855 [Paracoccaceae bacterium]